MIALMFGGIAVAGVLAVILITWGVVTWERDKHAERAPELHHEEYGWLPVEPPVAGVPRQGLPKPAAGTIPPAPPPPAPGARVHGPGTAAAAEAAIPPPAPPPLPTGLVHAMAAGWPHPFAAWLDDSKVEGALAIRDHGDWDAPQTAPRSWHAELRAEGLEA